MSKYILAYGLAFMLLSARASAQFLHDINGRPILETKYTNVEGSPYLYEDWVSGVVELAKGTSYKGIELKYDQVADELLFRHKEAALSFVEPVKEFKLLSPTTALFRNGYKPVDRNTAQTFYEVLYDGGTQLIRKRAKQIMENREYNSASSTKKFVPVETYFIVKDGLPVKIRKDKKSVLSVLKDKGTLINKYVESNKVNFKEDQDLIKLVEYYNTN